MTTPSRPQLPIDAVLGEITAGVAKHPALVLEAPPGSGKTTRVPPAFLEAPFLTGKEIIVLEPRRLAAKMAATRVADELGEEPGGTVGYHFRFEQVGGPKTRIRFVTEGMFLRRLLGDPTLKHTGLVIIDEFHERHLQGDLALALLRRLQQTTRPDLKVIVMSATLDGQAVAGYLGCPVIKAEGRRFPVDIAHAGNDSDPLDDRIAKCIGELLGGGHQGDLLVFLPGVAEIRRAQQALERRVGGELLILPLYADLPRKEQDAAVRRGPRQKVVLATNVAETSITIDGVTAVIDCGLARIASHNWWSGLPVLRLGKISQASAIQRAGRAGRTAPGRCIRLYGSADYAGRPSFETPEVQRLDLTQPLLELKAMGVRDPLGFPWYEAPPAAALKAAEQLLWRLGAAHEDGELTTLGRAMAAIPAHPRLSRVLLEAHKLGAAYEGATAAAWLGEQPGDAPDNEIGGLVEAVLKAERGKHMRISSWHTLERARQQLLRALPKGGPAAAPDPIEAVRKAVLTGFPDRVGRLRAVGKTLSRNLSGESVEVVLCGGGSARLLNPHLEKGTEFVVALDAEERSQGGLKGDTRLRLVAAIEPDWLLGLEPMTVEDATEAVWNAAQERVELRSRLQYDRLTLSETPVGAPTPEQAREAGHLLTQKALERGLASFVDVEELEALRERLRFLHENTPELGAPLLDAAGEEAVLRAASEGRTRFAELREDNPLNHFLYSLPSKVREGLDKLAPTHILLPGGRRLRVHYEAARPPWVESRLQDFFGMKQTPTLAGGRVPLVIHLLAPNHRAVQVTTDLAGFWERAYPPLRKELGRRYPRHSWPEDPLTAEPPSRR